MSLLTYHLAVIHYGSVDRTARLIESTLDLDPSPAMRWVVLNDGANRKTSLPDVIRAHCALIEPPRNLGYAGGANAAFEAIERTATPDAVWLLNNDTTVSSGAVRPLLSALTEDPSLALVGPRLTHSGNNVIWHDGGRIHWPDGKIESVGFELPPTPPPPGVQPTDFVCGCAPLIRTTAWRAARGFDEDFFLYYEDTDLSLRLKHLGWRLGHVPTSVVDHEGSATTGEGSGLSRYYQLRNRIRFVARHGPAGAAERLTRQLQHRARRLWLTGRWALARWVGRAAREAAASIRRS